MNDGPNRAVVYFLSSLGYSKHNVYQNVTKEARHAMEPMEREDSSTYVTQGSANPEAREEPRPVTPAEPPKKKKGKAALVLTLLLLLAIAGAAALGWLWYQQNGEIDDLRSDLSVARNDVQRLESAAKAEADLEDSDAVTTDTSDSQSEDIVKAALAFANAPVKPGDVKATIGKQVGEFAYVNVAATQGSGYYVILKNVNDVWVPILSGNGDQTQETLDTYGVPAELVKN